MIARSYAAAVKDIIGGALNWPMWVLLGWKDTRLRYRRTVIGPFWQTLSMAIFIGALGVVYSRFWGMEIRTFIPYLTAGMTVWVLISTILTEGTGIFVASTPFIMQKRIALSTFVYQLLYRNVIVFFHNLIVFVLVALIFRVTINATVLLAIPGLILVVANTMWMALLLGTFCTRFRDFANLVVSGLQIVFFITPIFWLPDQAGTRRLLIVDSNPFFNLIELVRGPLLGHAPSTLNWTYSLGLLVVGSIVALLVFGRFRSRIPYWI